VALQLLHIRSAVVIVMIVLIVISNMCRNTINSNVANIHIVMIVIVLVLVIVIVIVQVQVQVNYIRSTNS
jgi:hypothetical protein